MSFSMPAVFSFYWSLPSAYIQIKVTLNLKPEGVFQKISDQIPLNMSSVCSWSKYTLFYLVTVSMWGALSLIMLLTNQPRGLMFVQFTCFACAILSMCSRYYLVFDCTNSRVVGTNVWTCGKSTQQRNFLSESGRVYGMLADDLNTFQYRI